MMGIRKQNVLLTVLFVITAVGWTLTATADENATSPPLLDSTPWYDADSQRIVPVPLRNESDDTLHRNSRWLPKAERVVASKPSSSTPSSTSTQAWNGDNVIAWVVLGLLIGLIVFLLVYAFAKAEVQVMQSPDRRRKSMAAPDEQTLRRMQELPVELQDISGNPRDQALAWIERGDFDRAIIALFGHQLLMLDREGLLRLARGKTNGRYLRESTASDRAVASHLKKTVDAFERSYFGRHKLTRGDIEAVWRASEELERHIEQRRGVPV